MNDAYNLPPHVARPEPQGLGDVLDRVLDKGIVIAGDITIAVLDIELLTIRIRLLIASIDKAQEMGINWWERDSNLTSQAELSLEGKAGGRKAEGKARTARSLEAKEETHHTQRTAAPGRKTTSQRTGPPKPKQRPQTQKKPAASSEAVPKPAAGKRGGGGKSRAGPGRNSRKSTGGRKTAKAKA